VSNYRLTRGEKVFQAANYLFLALFGIFTLYPFWYVLQGSFTDPAFNLQFLWPRGKLYYANYHQVFSATGIGKAFLISIARVGVAVPLTILVTGSAAFALTRRELWGRKAIILLFFITMFFNGGLIPLFLVLRGLGLLDRFLVYVLPVLFNVWMMIVMKTSFQQLPEGLIEAAVIEGASYMHIFMRVIIPLSLPMVATLSLFNAVWHWNDWFFGAFYVIEPDLRPLQTFLREAVLEGGMAQRLAAMWYQGGGISGGNEFGYSDSVMRQLGRITPESLKLAFIVVTTVPIILVYPFIQKYFMKGVLIGSLKE
jgi:putative aldouronate transport system permease protein